jgi:hypothetical protein
MRKRFAIPYLAGRGTASVTVLILMACFSGAEPIVPVDGQVFTSSATFVPGCRTGFLLERRALRWI